MSLVKSTFPPTSTIMVKKDLPESLRSMARLDLPSFLQYMPSVASTFLISTFSKVRLDVKNTAAITLAVFFANFQQAKVDLMIAKLWKVS